MLARSTTKLAAALCALSLTACATVYEGKYNFSDGWREAKVVSIVPGATLENPRFWECTRKVESTQRNATNYVLLTYRARRQQRRMVPAPANLSLTPGERVYLNLATCEDSIAKPAAP